MVQLSLNWSGQVQRIHTHLQMYNTSGRKIGMDACDNFLFLPGHGEYQFDT